MKNQYLLFVVIISCFFQFIQAQSYSQYLTLGVARNNMNLQTETGYTYIDAFSSVGVDVDYRQPLTGFGISAGYTLRYHHRWEASFRTQYSGNTMTERFGNREEPHSPGGPFPRGIEEERKYRGLWFEGLIFWRMFDSYVKPDIQLGTGIAYLLYTHEYLSGFILNEDLGIYDGRTYTSERKNSAGMPFQLQLQLPIHDDWKLGFNAHLNLFFDGNITSGLTAYAAYRL